MVKEGYVETRRTTTTTPHPFRLLAKLGELIVELIYIIFSSIRTSTKVPREKIIINYILMTEKVACGRINVQYDKIYILTK